MDKVHEVKFNYIIFTQVITRVFRAFLQTSIQASSISTELRLRLRHPLSFDFVFLLFSFGLGFVILYESKYGKQNLSLKEEVGTRYDFVTGLR
jgi:hypothetical protein